MSVKDRPLHKSQGKSQIYCPERILGYGRRKDLLLSCRGSGSFRTDWWEEEVVEVLAPHWVRDSGCGGLESKFGQGPRHPGQESDGLVLLVPGVQAGRVFLGHLAKHIDSWIAGRSGTACLVFSTVVRTESGKEKKQNWLLNSCLKVEYVLI